MTALWITLGVLGFLLLALLLPVTLRVTYDAELRVKARVLAIPFTLYPRRERKDRVPKKARRERTSAPKGDKKAKKDRLDELGDRLKEDGVGAVLRYLSDMAALAHTSAARLFRAVTVDRLSLRLTIGGDNAAAVAVTHGAACGAVFPALAVLSGGMRVRRREVSVTPDFVGGEGRAVLDVRLHASPLRLLWAAVRFIIGFIGNTVKDNNPSA